MDDEYYRMIGAHLYSFPQRFGQTEEAKDTMHNKKDYFKQSWHYIPAGPDSVKRRTEILKYHLLSIKKPNVDQSGLKMLEIGCGFGFNLMYFRRMLYAVSQLDGIEINTDYNMFYESIINTGQYATPQTNIYNEDIFKFDKIKNYDVIYFYEPLRTPEMQEKFYKYLLKHAKKGALFLTAFAGSTTARTNAGWNNKKKVTPIVEELLYMKK